MREAGLPEDAIQLAHTHGLKFIPYVSTGYWDRRSRFWNPDWGYTFDGKTVETGSFNYSAAAEHNNAENVIVLWESPRLAAAYTEDWQRLWDRAEPYYKQ